MSDEGTSVTLIFYKIDGQFWKEPLLNIVAAAAQMSPFTHVEIALGEDPGHGGQMTNVARVFNDSIGVVSAPQYILPCCALISKDLRALIVKSHIRACRSQELTERTGRNPGAL